MDMIKVFVSYRRDDSRHQAGRLFDHLVEQFGKEYVFKDVDSIPLGSDFRDILTERVAGLSVFQAGSWVFRLRSSPLRSRAHRGCRDWMSSRDHASRLPIARA
jgi:hypothetical protein